MHYLRCIIILLCKVIVEADILRNPNLDSLLNIFTASWTGAGAILNSLQFLLAASGVSENLRDVLITMRKKVF